MSLLTVVTPVFNQERYIEETLDSVAAMQTPHEHLVIDGGSQDGTVSLLEARNDSALQFVSEPDRGQTHAVNKGFERAQGAFVGWVNADDAYIPQAVDRAVEFLRAQPDVAGVYGFMDIVDADGRVTRNYRPAPFNWRRYLYTGDYVPTPTIIFRRELLQQSGLMDETFEDAADYDFYLRLFHGRRVERRNEALLRFRYHGESKTAVDQDRGQREALRARLRWANGPRQALTMRAIDATKQSVFRVVNPWPPNRHVTRVVDGVAAVRERIAAG